MAYSSTDSLSFLTTDERYLKGVDSYFNRKLSEREAGSLPNVEYGEGKKEKPKQIGMPTGSQRRGANIEYWVFALDKNEMRSDVCGKRPIFKFKQPYTPICTRRFGEAKDGHSTFFDIL